MRRTKRRKTLKPSFQISLAAIGFVWRRGHDSRRWLCSARLASFGAFGFSWRDQLPLAGAIGFVRRIWLRTARSRDPCRRSISGCQGTAGASVFPRNHYRGETGRSPAIAVPSLPINAASSTHPPAARSVPVEARNPVGAGSDTSGLPRSSPRPGRRGADGKP